MEENKKVMITGIGTNHGTYIGELAKSLMEAYKDERNNPINLGITIEEFTKMNEEVLKSEKKSNGFLEGKNMNKILKKRK